MEKAGGAGRLGKELVSEALRARIRAVVDEHKMFRACAILGVNDRTATRILAGLVVNRGSIALVEKCLEAYDRERAAEGQANARANESKNSSKTREIRGKSDAA